MEKGMTSCVRSTTRTSGITEYITPRQIATESSTTPKSVINTIVGGYFCVGSLASTGCATAVSRKRTTLTAMPNRVESFFLRRDEVIGCIGPQFYSTEEKPESKTVAPHPRRAVYNAAAIQNPGGSLCRKSSPRSTAIFFKSGPLPAWGP